MKRHTNFRDSIRANIYGIFLSECFTYLMCNICLPNYVPFECCQRYDLIIVVLLLIFTLDRLSEVFLNILRQPISFETGTERK